MIRSIILSAIGSLKRKKIASLFTILTISLGMTMIVLLASLYNSYTGNIGPYQNRDRCLYLANLKFEQDGEVVQRMNNLHSTQAFISKHLKKLQTPELVGIYGRVVKKWNLGSRYKPYFVKYLETDANFWKIHNFKFVEGRGFMQKEMENKEYVCVISQKTANFLFKDDKTAVGKHYKNPYDNRQYVIVGVIKNVHPHYEVAADLYFPYYLSAWPEDRDNWLDENKNMVYYSRGGYKGVVLLKKGQAGSDVKKEFDQMVIKQNKTGSFEEFDQLLTHLKTPSELIPGLLFQDDDEMITTIVSLVMALCFLLVPVVLLSNINLYALRDRIEEIGIRKSYGADRKSIILQLLVENIGITLLGAFLAFVLTVPLNRLLVSIIYDKTDVLGMELNPIYFLVLFVGTVVFGVVTVVLPAWRISKIVPAKAINQQLQHTNDKIMVKIRKMWPQVTTYFVLFTVITMCCLFMVYVYKCTFSGMGYNHENVIKLGLWSTSNQNTYSDEYCSANFDQMKEQLLKVPDVEKVSYVFISDFWARSRTKIYALDSDTIELRTRIVDDAFFDLTEMKPIKGQLFSTHTDMKKYIPAVVTASAEDRFFNGDAIDNIITRKEDGRRLKVIGVVDTYKFSPRAVANPMLFSLQNAPARAVMIKYKAGCNTIALEENLRQLVQKNYGGKFRIQENRDMGAEYNSAVSDMKRLFYGIMLVMSFLLLNAFLGFYTLIWYNVRARKKEMGLRRAVGASKRDVQRKILFENLSIMFLGVGISTAFITQIIILIAPIKMLEVYWLALFWSFVITLLVSLLSIWSPARSAGRVQPIEALSEE